MAHLIKKNEGHWFYPVTDFVYDEAYLKKYEYYATTEMGKLLRRARLSLLKPYSNIIDVGVGSCDLIDHKDNAKGFDVNPIMIEKLKKENRWTDIYKEDLDKYDAICFFDSFEHIEDPSILLKKIKKSDIIMAIPIFYTHCYIFKSRHYRPDEHYHYFTFRGLLKYMHFYGFNCTYITDIEVELGRHDIFTFVFKKEVEYDDC